MRRGKTRTLERIADAPALIQSSRNRSLAFVFAVLVLALDAYKLLLPWAPV